jgi:hypothetical protein
MYIVSEMCWFLTQKTSNSIKELFYFINFKQNRHQIEINANACTTLQHTIVNTCMYIYKINESVDADAFDWRDWQCRAGVKMR